MKLVLKCTAYFLLMGLCLGAAAVRAQITNPTYAIVTLEHYQAYYSFYMLGPHLEEFARLGSVAAGLVCTTFLLWACRRTGVDRYLSYSHRGETFSWPWRTASVCVVFCLGLIWQVGWLVSVGSDLLNGPVCWVHHLLFAALPILPLVCLQLLDKRVEEHRLLRWPLGGLVGSGLLLAFHGGEIARQLAHRQFIIPPMVSTHYGPWGILGWSMAMAVCLGLACGVLMLGLAPHEGAEPQSLRPVASRNLVWAMLLGLVLSLALLATYPLYFQPRYQVGLSLRNVREELQKPSLISGRSVVWLDHHDPTHSLETRQSWSSPENLKVVEDWLVSAPSPSALTRPAAKMLGDHALWQWRPEAALDWLEVHRRRQKYSNLNRGFLEAIASSKPDPKLLPHLDSLLNRDRFAWPGPGSRLEIAAQLRRYGRTEEAKQWESQAMELGGDLLPAAQPAPLGGSLSGRLLLDGQPLAGARVALFKGQSSEELLSRSRQHVEGESALVEPNLRPVYYQYIDFWRLLNFYAVETTDQEGWFLFEDTEPGLFRLGVRLDSPANYGEERGLINLTEGASLELGEFHLTRP